MNNKKKIKSVSGFVIAILISIVFSYFCLNYYNSSDWISIVLSYFVLLAASLLIFCIWLEMQWFTIPFIPVFPLVVWVSSSVQRKIKKNLREKFVKQNIHSHIVVFVTNFSWYNVEYYLNTSPTHRSVAVIIEYLISLDNDFSFYLKPGRKDIESVMFDKNVREVYFLGHGNSREFQINATDSLKYKDFDNKKYFKDFVHQVHCGTKYGKPLRYYVVPKKNWKKCFFVRKTIAEKDILKYYKDKIKSLEKY
jgi:hypothetical protein